MRLAIADPPYLGRGQRWYGTGARNTSSRGVILPDFHPEAGEWDDPRRHVQMVQELTRDFDGWAIAASPDSLDLYLEACPHDVRVMVWVRGNALPSGARVNAKWEPVIVYIPAERRARREHLMPVDDVLIRGVQGIGFAGSKPPEWTRWVLTALGFDPAVDEVHDLFPGSGQVAAAADGMLL